MAKKDMWGNIILLGAVAVGGYFLWKYLQGNQGLSYYGGGGGGGVQPTTLPDAPKQPGVPTVFPEPKVIFKYGTLTVQPLPATVPRPTLVYINPLPSVPKLVIPAPIGVTAATLAANLTSQNWTAATYGQPGQPSAAFLATTAVASLKATSVPIPTTTKLAVAAIAAGAPPRLVAKMKAGLAY